MRLVLSIEYQVLGTEYCDGGAQMVSWVGHGFSRAMEDAKRARASAPGVIFDFRQIYETNIYC